MRRDKPTTQELIGRVRELEALRGAIATHAVVTLVGPPGAGKTTLGRALLASRPRGSSSLFVDLSASYDALGVLRALAETLRAGLGHDGAVGSDRAALAASVDRLLSLRVLEAARTLVVLDNAEQCIDDVAWLVGRWVGRAKARVVVTSREALRIAGERVVPVPPLSLPDEGADADAIFASEAVELVVRRAELAPRAEDAPRLAALVRRLDGIPLALELAARRVALLGLDDVSDRLAGQGREALELLTYGRRDAGERHSTLRSAIAWSYALLSPDERALFAALSSFRGAFSPDDAVAARPTSTTEAQALDVLQALCDKSLVARRADGRLALLAAIREHASEQPREPGTERRLAAHYAARARGAVEETATVRAPAALAWLSAELENLLGVFDALVDAKVLEPPSHDEAARESAAWLLLGVDAIVQRVGPGSMHASRLDRWLAAPSTPVLEVPLRVARARVHRDAGAMEACEAQLARALEVATVEQRPSVRAELGEARLARGAFDDAEATLREALSEAEATGSLVGQQKAAARLGLTAHARGRLEEAQRHYERALDLATRLAAAALEAAAHRDLGELLDQRGLFARARAHYA
ncbi:MAG: AAA family ATPase, partial [Sandaracinaceae bacterium]|nr:AAA family ATPase [Sandaracinaceae bacterium]